LDRNTSAALSGALEQYLRRSDADSTRLAYERELRRFLSWLTDDPHAETLFDYRDHLRDRELSPTTVRWRTTVARAFLLFAEEHGHVQSGAAGDFKPPRGKSGFAPRVLSASELQQLLNAPDRRSRRGRRDTAALLCLGIGGLRAGEVCRLNVEHVRIECERVVLHVSGKGRKERLVSIPGKHSRVFRAYLSSWPESHGGRKPLFWCGQPGQESKRMTVSAIDYLVRMHGRAAELDGIGAHALRHTAASLAIEAGEPLHRLRDRLGHSSVLVTSRYLHIS